ncbi:MAG: PKD domain-containing protein [Methanosarcinales archaeon]|nr:PKD domain-containing protein [Methanosarcinales archaeon]
MALKKIILIFAVMLTVMVLAGTGYASASPPAEEWNLTYEVSGITSVESFQQTADSGYIIAGNTRSNAFVLKTGPTGSEQWNRTFSGTFSDDRIKSVLQTSDGGYLIAGSTSTCRDNYPDIWLIKINTEGIEQWNLTLGGTGYGEMVFVQQTADGGYILIGNTDSHGAGSSDIWFEKVDSNGNIQWNSTFGGIGRDIVRIVNQVPGGYIITGQTDSYGAGDSDFWLVKTDTKGEEQWNNTYGGYYDDRAYSLQQTHDYGYIIAGMTNSFGASHNDFLLVKTDSNGTEQWYRTFGGVSHEFSPSVRLSPDGGYIFGGRTFSFDDGDYWLIKTDEDGNVQWDRTFEGHGLDSFQQTPDGGYIIKGDFYDPYKTWLVKKTLIKTDSNGNEQWDIRIEGDELDSVLQTENGGYILAGTKDSKLLLVKLMAERPTPSAQFTYDLGYPGANQTISFDASASHDPYGNITYYQWDLGDGSYVNTTQRTVTHSYDEGGNYSVNLTVTGINGDMSSITREITVQHLAPPVMRWDKTFGGDSSDQLYSLQQTFDGGYILGGDTRSFGTGSSDFWLVKIDNNGIELWNRTFGGANHESAHSVQQTSDGGFIMAGVTGSTYSYDCWLVKTDTEGVEMWNRKIVRPNYYNSPYSILQSPDGGYIIAGKTGSAGTEYYSDMWLASIDSDGYVQWEMTFGGTGPNVAARAVLLAPDGGLIVAGEKGLHTENDSDFWLAKFGGIPAEPESGDAPTDGEPVQTPDMPGFSAAVAVMGLLVWVGLVGRQ